MEHNQEKQQIHQHKERFEREMTEVLLNLRGEYAHFTGNGKTVMEEIAPVEAAVPASRAFEAPALVMVQPAAVNTGCFASKEFAVPVVEAAMPEKINFDTSGPVKLDAPEVTVAVAQVPEICVPEAQLFKKPQISAAKPGCVTVNAQLLSEFAGPEVVVPSVEALPAAKVKKHPFEKPRINISVRDAVFAQIKKSDIFSPPEIAVPVVNSKTATLQLPGFQRPALQIAEAPKPDAPKVQLPAVAAPEVHVEKVQKVGISKAEPQVFTMPQVQIQRPEQLCCGAADPLAFLAPSVQRPDITVPDFGFQQKQELNQPTISIPCASAPVAAMGECVPFAAPIFEMPAVQKIKAPSAAREIHISAEVNIAVAEKVTVGMQMPSAFERPVTEVPEASVPEIQVIPLIPMLRPDVQVIIQDAPHAAAEVDVKRIYPVIAVPSVEPVPVPESLTVRRHAEAPLPIQIEPVRADFVKPVLKVEKQREMEQEIKADLPENIGSFVNAILDSFAREYSQA